MEGLSGHPEATLAVTVTTRAGTKAPLQLHPPHSQSDQAFHSRVSTISIEII